MPRRPTRFGPNPWRGRILLATIVALVGAGWIERGRLWSYARRGVHVEIEEALVREKPGREHGGLLHAADKVKTAVGALAADQVHVRLRVRNDTVLPARIHGVRYRVRIGGRDIGAGAWAPPGGPQWFLPGRDVVIVAAFDPDWSSLAGSGIDALRGRATPIAAAGEIRLAFGSVPFEVSRVGWTRSPPAQAGSVTK